MALFGAMFVLAIIPSPSVMAVIARSVASGFTQGLATVVGIVIGDFIFIVAAIYGLSTIAAMDSLFILVKYCGCAYLIWLGIKLCRSQSRTIEIKGLQESSWLSNFLSGLLITLGDQKAILFYLSFFPAFLDMANVSLLDLGIVMAVSTVAVGGVKLGYAYLADRARFLFKSSRARRAMNVTAGSVMIVTGVFILAKT